MRYYDNGAFYTVSYSANDAAAFARRWPCSTVRGRGSFTYDARHGDLVDATGTASEIDGSDWLAFSHDCQAYAMRKRTGPPPQRGGPSIDHNPERREL
jgi:hypothetical protein